MSLQTMRFGSWSVCNVSTDKIIKIFGNTSFLTITLVVEIHG